MKAELSISPEFICAVADAVVERLRPMIHTMAVPAPQRDDLMSVEDLAVYLGGVSVDWIYQRTAKNEIPFAKVGRLVKFRRSDIDRWLSTQSVPALAPLSASLPSRRARD